jgi:DNA polymerase III sliding clamp (beta) subunit (PCNA family)
MRITVDCDTLRAALATAIQVVPSKPHLAALAGVLLNVRGDTLRCIGSDGDSTLSVSLEGASASDGQVLLVPAPLTRYLATVGSNPPVTLSVANGGDLTVAVQGRADYHFRPMPATFTLPGALRNDPHVVDWSPLSAALSAVEKAAGKEERVVQLVSKADGSLSLHTTDHYRLAKACWKGGGFGEFVGVLDLQLLRTVAKHGIDQVTVSSDGKQLRLAGGAMVLSTRLKAVAFPAVDTVMSHVPAQQVRLSARDLGHALERLSAVCGDDPVHAILEDASLTLKADNPAIGDATERIALPAAVPAPFEFAADATYLRDALVGHSDDLITLAWSSPTAPLYLTSTGTIDVSSVVMPVRLLSTN